MTRHQRSTLAAIVGLSGMLLCPRAEAANCSISTTAISFGVYDVFSATPTDSTGTLTFKCSGNASVTVNLNKGASSTFNPRVLTSGTEVLNYNLYVDSARNTIWGDSTGGTSRYINANPANNSNIVVTIYGRIAASQDVGAGSYSDSITATINF